MELNKIVIMKIKCLEDSKGRITPKQVLETAKDKKSPLHSYFEWDDTEAAYKWRIEQARELIRRVKIEIVIEEKTIRSVAYVHDPRLEIGKSGYVQVLKMRGKTAIDMIRAELHAIIGDWERVEALVQVQLGELPEGLLEEVTKIKNEITKLEENL